MPKASDNIEILCGSGNFEEMPLQKPLEPFNGQVCEFLSALSAAIMKDPSSKRYPDVVTFGFFCRKANIESLKKAYEGRLDGRVGRGVSFHIAPSNVPINFAYSLVSALLAGNVCVVRASSKKFEQVDIVCGHIGALLSEERFALLSDYVRVVRYPHDEGINSFFSALTDVRVIWGGDETIASIRRSPLPPRASEIAFADRYSIAVIGAKGYLSDADAGRTAQDFYNDTYLYDQNACSSPRLIYWLGEADDIARAKERFWGSLHELLTEKYTVEPVIAVDKYTAGCRLMISKGARLVRADDNLISRIEVDALFPDIYEYRCAGGSFIEYSDSTLDALSGIVTRRYQTLSYIGEGKEMLAKFVSSNGLCGIDRIVPIGKTADFSLVWDGYDLIMQMTRVISVI